MGKRVTHYARTGDHPACGKGTWIPPSRLTDSLTEVTSKNCQQTTGYRAEVFAADATATARAIRHELPGQVVLNPGWFPPGGGAAA